RALAAQQRDGGVLVGDEDVQEAAGERPAQRIHLGLAAGDRDHVAIVTARERLQPIALDRQQPPGERAQLRPIHYRALGVEGLVVDLAYDAQLPQPLDAHTVRLREPAEARRLPGDHA